MATGNEIQVQGKFSTPFEKGCVALTLPDEFGNFQALDSDGVECTFNICMVLPSWDDSYDGNLMDGGF